MPFERLRSLLVPRVLAPAGAILVVIVVAIVVVVLLVTDGGSDDGDSGSAAATMTPTASPTDETPDAGETATATPTPEPDETPAADATPTEPPELSTYSNEQYGFSVDYPADWTPQTIAPQQNLVNVLLGVLFEDESEMSRGSVTVYQNPSDLDLQEWIAEKDSSFFDEVREASETTIDGAAGWYTPIGFLGTPNPTAYVEQGDYIYGLAGPVLADYDTLVSGFSFD